ncbi:MAG: Hsp70 family protein, partial [Candidatus Saccharimonadales bacterium]|nr:Hsp70 family protein [Candidatus Saccharimonadales bacterium]
MSETINVGLDFGTSNSGIAAYENGEVEIFRTREGQPTQPSSIFIRIDGYVSVGDQAVEDYLNPEQHGERYHFIPSLKPALHEERYDGNVLQSRRTIIDGRYLTRYFPVQELGAAVISDLKNRAETVTDRAAEGVVLGRPVFFSDNENEDRLAQERLRDSAEKAGFKEIQFVLEPVAAALYYERNYAKPEAHKVFVFDFGGGTLDVSVLNYDQNHFDGQGPRRGRDPSETVLSTNGIDLGGTDFDKDVFRGRFLRYFGSEVTYDSIERHMPAHIHANITEWHLIEAARLRDGYKALEKIVVDRHCSDRPAVERLITLIEDQQVFSLLRTIEGAKIQLGTVDPAQISHHHKSIEIDEPLSRAEFEEIIEPRLDLIQA